MTLVSIGGLLTTPACANAVVGYCQKNNLSTQLVDLLKPLGSGGMDENEKALVDEVILLPPNLQIEGKTLSLLNEIALDGKVTQDEIAKFGDLDGDGLKNSEEVLIYHTDPQVADSDRDGLKDGEEVITFKTDPLRVDSDDDGFNDGVEVLTLKTNPLDRSFDYDVDTLITDYEQVKPIVEKIANDLNITSTLNKTIFHIVPHDQFRTYWEKYYTTEWLPSPLFLNAIWDIGGDPLRCHVYIPHGEFYKVAEAVFTALGDANHFFLCPEHYRLANETMREATRYAFEAAALNRLEEMGCKAWQIGETSEGRGWYHERVRQNYKVLQPIQLWKFVAEHNWLAATDDEGLGLADELRTQRKLGSKSCLKLHDHLLKQDNAYFDRLRERMLQRTTWNSYTDEVFGIIESRFVPLKPPEKRDTDIATRGWFFLHP